METDVCRTRTAGSMKLVLVVLLRLVLHLSVVVMMMEATYVAPRPGT